jgi:hypothetical protein
MMGNGRGRERKMNSRLATANGVRDIEMAKTKVSADRKR